MTYNNARAIGLNDRGLIRAGYKADINVINYDQLQLDAPKIHYDLPAGGKRLIQKAKMDMTTLFYPACQYG